MIVIVVKAVVKYSTSPARPAYRIGSASDFKATEKYMHALQERGGRARARERQRGRERKRERERWREKKIPSLYLAPITHWPT